MSFDLLGLSPAITQAVAKQGYDTPSPIQAKAIPVILEGRDIMAAAQTGTGKTAGFTLPMLEILQKGAKPKSNHVRALVLTPTRELAAQVADNVAVYSAGMSIKSTVVFGGVKINPQMMRLRAGVDVLVATPGRLLDLYQQGAIKFSDLEFLVLDEADRMLDMGFIRDIRKIIAALPANRQTLMFSATFSDDIRTLAKSLLKSPVEISVAPPNSTIETVKQWLSPVDKKRKPALLLKLIKDNDWHQVLVFSRTKHGANRLSKYLTEKGVNASAIHGNKSQGARTRALAEFKSGDVQVLVATDIAARGIDIDLLPQVVNFDLPNVAEDYVHRIGRTGRAGASGQAVSLVSADEYDDLCGIEQLIQQHIEREVIEGFDPDHGLRASKPIRPIQPKKPKKPKKPQSNFTAKPRSNTRSSGARTDSNRGAKPAARRPRQEGAAATRRPRPEGAPSRPKRQNSSQSQGEANGNHRPQPKQVDGNR